MKIFKQSHYFNVCIEDNPSFELWPFPLTNCSSKIKCVSYVTILNNMSFCYQGSNVFYFRPIRSIKLFRIDLFASVVYDFNLDKYFYMILEMDKLSKTNLDLLNNNYYCSDTCIEITGTYSQFSMQERLVPHLNAVKQTFNSLDFSEIKDPKSFDFLSLDEYIPINKPKDIIPPTQKSISLSGSAVCSCGYISESVEATPNYKCPQCKIWAAMS